MFQKKLKVAPKLAQIRVINCRVAHQTVILVECSALEARRRQPEFDDEQVKLASLDEIRKKDRQTERKKETESFRIDWQLLVAVSSSFWNMVAQFNFSNLYRVELEPLARDVADAYSIIDARSACVHLFELRWWWWFPGILKLPFDLRMIFIWREPNDERAFCGGEENLVWGLA